MAVAAFPAPATLCRECHRGTVTVNGRLCGDCYEGLWRKNAAAADGPSYLETAAEFCAEVDPPQVHIIGELVPMGVTVLMHGEPRTRKSWAAMELAIAAATGTPAFGQERFAAPLAVPTFYGSQEDGRRDFRSRLWRCLRARDQATPPPTLFLSVHANINLESQAWQAAIVRDFKARGIKLAVFDPIRRFSPNVDKGPSEVRAVTGFLRQLTVETGCTTITVHHDVKPGQEADTRRRGHKASGGDWFAASDCPIHLEAAGRDRTLVVPEDYKHGTDPASFAFRIEEDEGKTWARVASEDVAAEDVGSLALHGRILDFLGANPGATGRSVVNGVRARREAVMDALAALGKADKVDSVKAGRSFQWFIKGGA